MRTAHVLLDALRELLEIAAGRAAAARAGDRRSGRNGAKAELCRISWATTTSWRAVAARLRASARRGSCRRCLPAAGPPSPPSRRRCPWRPCPPRSGRDAAGSRSARRDRDRSAIRSCTPLTLHADHDRVARQARAPRRARRMSSAETTDAPRACTSSRIERLAAASSSRPSCGSAGPGRGCPS